MGAFQKMNCGIYHNILALQRESTYLHERASVQFSLEKYAGFYYGPVTNFANEALEKKKWPHGGSSQSVA